MKLAPLVVPPLLLTTAARADVHTVSDDGTREYIEIADAVAASVPGDLVLVFDGVYDLPVTLDGLAVDVVAWRGATVWMNGPLVVRNVAAQDAVTLSGLTFRGGFAIEDCDGIVQIQDCDAPSLLADPPSVPYWQWADCGIGGSGQRVVRSDHVAITTCDFRGGAGGQGIWDGMPGDHGLVVEDSTVFLNDTFLRGGDGGAPPDPTAGFVLGGAGGDGLHVEGASSILVERLTAFGGLGWTSSIPQVIDGCHGEPIRAAASATVTSMTSPEVRMSTTTTMRGGQPELLQVFAEPGATLVLVSSSSMDWRPFGSFMGTLLVGMPYQIEVMGTVPSGGLAHHNLMPPDPGTDEDHIELQLQVLSFHRGQRVLSKPWRMTVIDQTL